MSGELIVKALMIEKEVVGQSQEGISCTSDRATYPSEIKGGMLPEDVYHRDSMFLWVVHEGGYNGLFHDDSIIFNVHGEFRSYEVLVVDENEVPIDPVMPVMADVYVSYDTSGIGAGKAAMSKIDLRCIALDAVRPPAENPRIAFLCQGTYQPAPDGYFPFEFVVEVDQEAGVTLVEDRTGTDVKLEGDPGKGVILRIESN